MKIMFQALQAVTVELTGILLTVWLLFGCASWSIRTTSERGDSSDFTSMLDSMNSQLTEIIPKTAVENKLSVLKRT